MADATPSRLGQINNTGGSFANDNALFLKVFAGEVMSAFEETNVMLPLHMVRTIDHGKSAQFPKHWKAVARYHTPGAEIVGQAIKGNERTINIDDLLIADAFIANIDEAKAHYDYRSIYTKELGRALSYTLDKNLLKLVCLAARASSDFSGGDGFGGTQLTNAGYDTTADVLVQGLYDAAQAMDEKDVPQEDRHVVLKPKHYNLLVNSSKAVNRDWNMGAEGNGSIAKGKVLEVAGFQIHKSNHVPSSNIAAVTGEQNTYAVNATNTVCVAFHAMALGTVKLLDLALESEYDIRRQGTLFVAKYAMGHGILRPECAVELLKA